MSETNESTNAVCSPLRRAVLVVLLWTSGFCGISYEILYARLLGNLLGDQFGVSAAVLLTFLLGIGMGTLHAHRWQRWLWAIEFGIGLCAVGFAFFIGPFGELLYSRVPVNFSGLGGAMLISILLLFVPTFLIGATLPLFAAYLNRATGKAMFANTYLVYNIGAALTALGIEFVLVRKFGLKLATLMIANLNFIVCAGVFFVFADFWKEKDTGNSEERRSWPAGRLLLGLVLASVASAVFQLTMIKVAEGFLGPFRETFALVLTVTLLGIAAGAVLVRRWRPSFGSVLMLALAGVAWMFWRQESLLEGYADQYASASAGNMAELLWLKLKVLAFLMGPAAVGFGATIPALLTDESKVSLDSGRLLCVSSIANAGGFLLMAFVLHERFDYRVIILIVVGLTTAAALLAYGLNWRLLLPPLAAAGIVLGPAKAWDETMLYVGYHEYHKPSELGEAREQIEDMEIFKGRQDNFAIVNYDGKPYLMINGYRSIMLNTWYEKGVGAITSTFAPRLDDALVLGLGCGATAATVGQAFEHTDVVEINPVLARNQYRFRKYNFDIAGNSKVNIILDDGIHYLRRTEKTYSLILNTVTSPLYFSSSKLYTEDFLVDVRKRLAPDGVYMTWLDSRIGDRGINIMLTTVAQVFPHCRLAYVRSGYFLLIASVNEPARPWHPAALMKSDKVRKYLFHGHDLNPAWMPYAVIIPNAYELIGDPATPLNTLDRPTLEFVIASLGSRGFSRFRERLKARLDARKLAGLSTPSFNWNPTHFADHAKEMLPEDNWLAKSIESAARPLVADFDNQMDLARADFHAQRAAVDPSARDQYWAGVWARRGHDYDRAIVEIKKALEMKPDYNNAWYAIGQCLERKGELDAAFDAFKRELELDPDDEDVAPRLARIRIKQGRHAEAIPWLTQALDEEEDAQLRQQRAECYEKTDQKEQAAADYRKLLSTSDSRKAALEGLLRNLDPDSQELL